MIVTVAMFDAKTPSKRRHFSIFRSFCLLPLAFCFVRGWQQVTEEIIEKVLKVAVSDPSVDIRQSLLRSFDRWFDVYLSRAHHVQVRCRLGWGRGR